MFMKCVEIRDHATCIPAIAFKMIAADAIEDSFLWCCGYPRDGSGVVLMKLHDQRAHSDPYDWVGNRTMRVAHLWIEQWWDRIESGDVVDVRVILGETAVPASPEIHRGVNV